MVSELVDHCEYYEKLESFVDLGFCPNLFEFRVSDFAILFDVCFESGFEGDFDLHQLI